MKKINCRCPPGRFNDIGWRGGSSGESRNFVPPSIRRKQKGQSEAGPGRGIAQDSEFLGENK